MMKFKKPRVSIRSKMWLAIVGTVVAVIAVLWLLQVVFLEDYYLRFKKDEFSDVVKSVTRAIDSKGIKGSQDELYNLASQHILCIDVSDIDGRRIVTYEGLNYNCYVHKNEMRRLQFVQLAIDGNGDPQIVTVDNPSGQKGYFISATMGETTDKTTNEKIGYIVTVSVALASVQEASLVIRNQLSIISIILILVATAVAFWISSGLTKNILKINRAAKSVANGSFDVDVSVKSNDELGDLSKSFSDMTKEIAKVNVLQKELVANISHDIRTPLTMIKGYAEAIKDITGDDKEMREHQLDIIVEEANRLNVLVNDVMDLSLMQAGQSPLNITDFDITAKASDILSRFQLLEQTNGFTFELVADKTYRVLADEVRIEQVLYNMINNAVNHIGEIKQVTVTITAAKNNVMVTVKDTGVGIAKEDLPLIWDRYYKPYKKTQVKGLGTGLGLSIVKAILINHGSRFGVNSTLGVGSSFWFTLKSAPIDETRQ